MYATNSSLTTDENDFLLDDCIGYRFIEKSFDFFIYRIDVLRISCFFFQVYFV